MLKYIFLMAQIVVCIVYFYGKQSHRLVGYSLLAMRTKVQKCMCVGWVAMGLIISYNIHAFLWYVILTYALTSTMV